MKRIITLLISVLLLIMLMPGCIGEKIANTDSDIGNITFSGKWPVNTLGNISGNSKSIYSEAGSITLVITSGTKTKSKTIQRTSGEDKFSINFEELTLGTWILTLEIYDQNGKKVGSKSQPVLVSAGDNPVSIVMSPTDYTIGPDNYAELFLPDSLPRWIGSISYHYEVMAYLKIKSIDIGLAEAYYNSEENSILNKEKIYNWGWTHIGQNDESSDTSGSAIDIVTGSGIVATMDYTYSGNKITSAEYTNEGGYSQTATVTYNDIGRLETVTETFNADDFTTSSEMTFEYSGGNVSGVIFSDSNSNSGPFTPEYSGSKLISDIQKNADGETESTEKYNWSDDELVSSTSTGVRGSKTSTYTYENSQLNTASITIEDVDENVTKQTITYNYAADTGNLEKIIIENKRDEGSTEYDYNNSNLQDYYIENEIYVKFKYDSSNRVIRTDYILHNYNYYFNDETENWETDPSDETMFYELINYRDDADTEVIVEIK